MAEQLTQLTGPVAESCPVPGPSPIEQLFRPLSEGAGVTHPGENGCFQNSESLTTVFP